MYFLLNSPFLGWHVGFPGVYIMNLLSTSGLFGLNPHPHRIWVLHFDHCRTSHDPSVSSLAYSARQHLVFVRWRTFASDAEKGDISTKRQWQNTYHTCTVHFIHSSLVILSSCFMRDVGKKHQVWIMNDMEMTIAQMFHLCSIYLLWQ